jgi:hypothetical protein
MTGPMKALLTLLVILSLSYFGTSCKKGDTGNVVPPYDSTHYNDSVEHVTDSVKHVADSIYNSPYGTYYGIFSVGGTYLGHIFGSSDSTFFFVAQVPGGSIHISSSPEPGYWSTYDWYFPKNSENHYHVDSSGYEYNIKGDVYIGNGGLSIKMIEQGGAIEGRTDNSFLGGKKK